ncbi:MAG: polysaccharide pyruvyl transferase family protein [Elusimicrobiota bacterium]|jgi:hypothetical protein|nr:polysaccharide pyruvyl transferase family protein [Elusimicrobiota bacterium]
MKKIHFIHRIANVNAGDLNCCPLSYYYDFFKDYNVLKHDIWNIDYSEISGEDIVILGGGGMLYVEENFQENINRLLNLCKNVIGWSIGFNTHSDRPIRTQIDLTKFALLGIRDFAHPSKISYLPCVSCKHSDFYTFKNTEIKREIGIVEHKYFPVIKDLEFERIDNSFNFVEIIKFIASSKIIITSSYHLTYWATLMEKKVIVDNPFSTKFKFFKHKPIFYSGNLGRDISSAKIYPNALKEAIELNDKFFEKVKKIVVSVIPKKSNEQTSIFLMNRDSIIEQRLQELQRRIDNKAKFIPKPLGKICCWFILKKKNRDRFCKKYVKGY